MNDPIRVRPAEGGRVYHPGTHRLINPEGELVDRGPQILRYLHRGDLELVVEAAARPAEESKPARKTGK